MPIPRLRSLDLVATEWNGQRVVCARDHEGLLDAPVLVPLPVMAVALLLDGRRDVREVQVEYARLMGGALLPAGDLDQIVRDLDAHGLLDSPALAARRREIAQAYRRAPHRMMAHADLTYPRDPARFAALLDVYLGVGASAAGGLRTAADDAETAPEAPPRGALAPHIDFRRGGAMYGRAYRMLRDLAPGTCVVIVGVAHAGPPSPFVLTRKGYETPYGVIEIDRPLLDAVAARAPYDLLAEEPAHRGEHSIEFQVLFLSHVLRGRPFTILPVLTSALEGWCGEDSPARSAEVEGAVQALRGAIQAAGRPVCVVGGVDLSHVGSRFGDPGPLASLGAAARKADHQALALAARGDAEGWWASVAAGGNRHHVCGIGAIYTVLRLLAPVRGRVLGYEQGADPSGGLVGFSAVVFEGREADGGGAADG